MGDGGGEVLVVGGGTLDTPLFPRREKMKEIIKVAESAGASECQ